MLRLVAVLSVAMFLSVIRVQADTVPSPHPQASYGQQTEALINQARAQYGLGPIRVDPRLESSSDFHNKWMADHACFGHQAPECPGEPGVAQRMYDAGYSHNGIGEIVAAGQRLPEEAVAAWMNSPDHRHIILDNYVDFGCAYLNRPGSQWTFYWTCDFANPGNDYVPPGNTPTPVPTVRPTTPPYYPTSTPRPTTPPYVPPTPYPTQPPFRPTATAVPPSGGQGRTAYVTTYATTRARQLVGTLCPSGWYGVSCRDQAGYYVVVVVSSSAIKQAQDYMTALCSEGGVSCTY